ncbi:mannosyltransferase complex subunit Alg1 [Schizosaccharomyces japonicus yFS275]|uniref:Chitobiosyldiphosphodolichol beta-mannosyltransferase n=1 Tax=Schizosaccharomyces japonicus (strain yFS275 / FY16936) TaxID=402676 RepID=B6JZQ7_SCHJY|nr:mannosyltransferase complex subunit Alg1 [Schizosaccharomyces japonicus yFS275]EEB07025.1 mannosyltransferase complex subunit Alg1 [Schizosaccharomyces japonicus yFS275]
MHILIGIAIAVAVLCLYVQRRRCRSGKQVAILVLGDIGHSPRMQYHANSFAKHDWNVELIGYGDDNNEQELFKKDKRIRCIHIPKTPAWLTPSSKLQFLLFAPLKVTFLWLGLCSILFRVHAPSYLLVQNPPCIPTFVFALLMRFCFGSRIVIDWHNFGFSILALKLGKNHMLVKIMKAYELFLGRFAYKHLCVSNAMSEVLGNWGLKPTYVLYDRPPSHFKPLSKKPYNLLGTAFNPKTCKLLVSSTSWTPDEDIFVLYKALEEYDAQPNASPILAVITGKGPMKQDFLDHVKEHPLQHVRFLTPWLSTGDYPRLLACADLGVSLHTSSSGVDLPMKVVDLFGCGIPVLSLPFPAITELVKDGRNGKIVGDAHEMAVTIQNLFTNTKELSSLKRGAMSESKHRWDEEWDTVASQVFLMNNKTAAKKK